MLTVEIIRQIEQISLKLRRLLELPLVINENTIFRQVSYDDLAKRISQQFSKIDIIGDEDLENSYIKRNNDRFEIHIGDKLNPKDRIDYLMHEMAHFILHEENLTACCSLGKYSGTVSQESEANCFSRTFLIPRDFFVRALTKFSRNDGSVKIEEMANYFEVKESLIIERGRDLMIWS